MIEQVVSGKNITQLNGPFQLPAWDGEDGLRVGQLAYDVAGVIDGAAGTIEWNGSIWRKFASGGGVIDFGDGVTDQAGFGSPEGVVTAAASSTYRQKDGSPGAVFWIKQSGVGNTGWAPIG